MDATKTAVAHHQQHVARMHAGCNVGDDFGNAFANMAFFASGGQFLRQSILIQSFLWVEFFVALYRRQYHKIGLAEGGCQLMLKKATDHRITARVKKHPQPTFWESLAQAGNGLRHSSGVVRKIIHYRHIIHCAAYFLATRYTLEVS